jgi:hypothetical protein
MLFVVPLTDGDGWQVLTYRKIPGNLARFTQGGLEIRVMRSASPVIYPLPAPLRVQRLRVRGRIEGALNVTAKTQGQQGFDDYALRVGLVEAGPRRLGFFERRFAPEWVRTLFSLASSDAGISQVRFFNLGVAPDQIGTQRRHPLSDLLHEEIVAVPTRDGTFEIAVSFGTAIQTVALWISADGDDTNSAFDVTLESIELEGVEHQAVPVTGRAR